MQRDRWPSGRSFGALIAAGVILAGCASVAPRTAPSQTATSETSAPSAPSARIVGSAVGAWEQVMAQVGDDGSVSKDVALEAVAVALGAPIPGVTVPDGTPPIGIPISGPIRWLAPYADQLSPEQLSVITRYLGPHPFFATNAAPGTAGSARNGPVSLRSFCSGFSAGGVDLTSVIQGAASTLAGKLGQTLPAGYPSCVVDLTANPWNSSMTPARAAPSLSGDDIDGCEIRVFAGFAQASPTTQRSIMLHELLHCYQLWWIGSYAKYSVAPGWIMEGMARWVGEELLPSGYPGRPEWDEYVDGTRPFFSKKYGAFGLWAHLQDVGIDPWPLLEPMVLAAITPQRDRAAFDVATKGHQRFFDTWVSSMWRDATLSDAWQMHGTQPVAAPNAVGVNPLFVDQITESAPYVVVSSLDQFGTFADHRIHVATEVVVVSSANLVPPTESPIRLTDGHALDRVVTEPMTLCMRGSCTCPDVATPPTTTPSGSDLDVAALGGAGAGLTLVGESLDELCHGRKALPDQPCADAQCGGDNGDPHLLTVDGLRYDFQARGEFTALRAPDGSVTIQTRQQAWSTDSPASINTAVAFRAGGHRISIVAPSGTADLSTPLRVRVDGTETDLPTPTNVGGITLTPFTHAVQIDLPDGTRAWAISAAPYGINLEVKPSAQLRSNGQGLLATRAANGVGLPLLPDGTAIPRPTTAGALDHLLYERFADAWRITQTDSAFDYDPGTSTATFTQAYLPSHANAVRPDAIATATSACQGISDANATADCTEDVILTGEPGFAQQARTLGTFFSRGASHLDDSGAGTGAGVTTPPPSDTAGSTTPPPSDTGGTSAAMPIRGGTFSVTPVTGMPEADMITIEGAPPQTIGPDNSVFIENVLPADAQHDAVEFVWIGHDGSVKARLNRPEQRDDIIGFTYAAGSLWLETSTATTCTVHRLDPANGNENAHVDVGCLPHVATAMATFHDAPWFVGKTDAGPVVETIDATTNLLGTVVHLKPTDPSTGKIAATDKALFYGDGDAIRIDPTSGTEALILDDTHGRGIYPAGDGVWTEVDGSGTTTFSNAPGAPQRTVSIAGELLAASDQGLWTERRADGLPHGQDGGGIYRSAIDGSGTSQVSPDELYGFPWGRHPMAVPDGFVLVVAGSNVGNGIVGLVYEMLDAG